MVHAIDSPITWGWAHVLRVAAPPRRMSGTGLALCSCTSNERPCLCSRRQPSAPGCLGSMEGAAGSTPNGSGVIPLHKYDTWSNLARQTRNGTNTIRKNKLWALQQQQHSTSNEEPANRNSAAVHGLAACAWSVWRRFQTALNQHVVPLVRRALSDSSNKVIVNEHEVHSIRITYLKARPAPGHSGACLGGGSADDKTFSQMRLVTHSWRHGKCFLLTALNQHVVPLVRRALSDSSNKVIITGKRGKAIVYSHEQQAPLHSFPIQTACQLSFELQPKQLRGKQGGRY